MYTYPANMLDVPEDLLSTLGSLWDTAYQGKDLLTAICTAKLLQQRQAYQNGAELLAACSRLLVPVYHTEHWYPLTLTLSQLDSGNYALAEFGEADLTFSPNSTLRFGVPVQRTLYAWPLPTGYAGAPAIFNRITDPSVSLLQQLDYQIENGLILFRDNPFNNPSIPQTPVFSNGVQTDSTITLWSFQAQFDRHYIYEQFGNIFGLQAASSENYRDLVNGLFDSLVLGSTNQVIKAVWSAATGVPLAKDNETVQVVTTDATRLLIITDKNVYTFNLTANAAVAVGDVLQPGDELTDALQFFDFNRGQCPQVEVINYINPSSTGNAWAIGQWALNEWLSGHWYAVIPGEETVGGTTEDVSGATGFALNSLALGKGFMTPEFFGDLVFINADTPLIVTEDAEGFTKVSWKLAGWPGDVELFFDIMHQRGVASGQTLAHLLDTRPLGSRDTEPTAGSLPPVINPLKFICQNVLRDNAFLVKIRGSALREGVGMNTIKFLRNVIPPQTAMLVVSELETADAPIAMDGPGTATAPGYEENVVTFAGLNFSESINGATTITENVRLFQISGRCS